MKPVSILLVLLLFCCGPLIAQQVDSIFFHLYTDSLKKGTHNYINVDGKTQSGQWIPLTKEQLQFNCSAGKFEGNNLVLDKNFAEDSVVVTVGLKSNVQVKKAITIYVKKLEDSERLKTKEEILREIQGTKKGKN